MSAYGQPLILAGLLSEMIAADIGLAAFDIPQIALIFAGALVLAGATIAGAEGAVAGSDITVAVTSMASVAVRSGIVGHFKATPSVVAAKVS